MKQTKLRAIRRRGPPAGFRSPFGGPNARVQRRSPNARRFPAGERRRARAGDWRCWRTQSVAQAPRPPSESARATRIQTEGEKALAWLELIGYGRDQALAAVLWSGQA